MNLNVNPEITVKVDNNNSFNILRLYRDNRYKLIDKEYDSDVEQLQETDLEITYNKLVESFNKELINLYELQFTNDNGELHLPTSEELDDAIIIKTDYEIKPRYIINMKAINKRKNELLKKKELKIKEVDETIAACSALLEICSTKEEVEEILKRYGIIDKKGLIVLEKI